MDRKIPLIYDTLSDCINDPNVVGGMVVKTLGASAIDDGEGRIYKVYDDSMGVEYDRTKHIQLAKSGIFMGKIDDTPLYEGLKDTQRDIEILKTASSIADLTHVERFYLNEEELKRDPKLVEDMVVKTVGKDEPGDGLGRTYLIVYHDSTKPYAPDEIQLNNWDIAAKAIDASLAEALTNENSESIDDIENTINNSVMIVFGTLNEFKESEDVKPGMTVKTLGRTTIGDGINATYKVYTADTPYDQSDIDLAPDDLYAYFVKENAEEEATISEISSQVSGLTTALTNTNERVETINNRVTSTNQSLNDLRSYTYTNVNDLLYQINEPFISDSKHLRYFDVEKDPDTGEVLNKEFIIAIESSSNGIKQIIIPKYEYPGENAGDTILGFYKDGVFYKDSKHQKPITPNKDNTYVDLTTGQNNAVYTWNGSSYDGPPVIVYCYLYNDKPYEDEEHTTPIEPVAGTYYIDKVDTDKIILYDSDGHWVQIEDASLVYGDGSDEPVDIPEVKNLYKEIKSDISADITSNGPVVTVDVVSNSAGWIKPLLLDHFIPEEDPEPDDRPIVNGYYFEDNFYTTADHVAIIEPQEDTIYVDITDGADNAKYIWTGEYYTLIDDYTDIEASMHFFDYGTKVMLNSDTEYPVYVTHTIVKEEYTDDEGQIVAYDEPHYVFTITRAPEDRVVYYV